MTQKRLFTLMVLAGLLILAVTPALAAGDPVDYPNWTSGDAAFECAQIGTYDNAWKINGAPPAGSSTVFGNTITFSNTTAYTFDWSATDGISAVIVKAATGANVWFYDPASLGDTGLYAFENKEISHVTLCWNDGPSYVPLTAVKTAAGSYDRTVTWDLTKVVDVDAHTGRAGETAGSSTWTVVATKNDSGPFNYQVAGSITVYNSNAIPVDFSVSDSIAGAVVNCPTSTVAAFGEVTCSYAAPGAANVTSNTATITSLTDGVGGTSATANFSYTENLSGYNSGTLSDPRFNYSETISASKTKTFTESFVCPADASLYGDNGTYSYTETNTATLNGNINLQASDDVTVTCTLEALVPSKTATGTYDRTVEWTLVKSVNPTVLNGYSNEVAGTVTWTVDATKTETLDNYQVTGTITVSNPAAIAQTFSASDVLNDGTVASVTCATNTVPAGGSVDCSYTAVPANASATLNTVTVSAVGNADQTATADVSFTENLIGYDEGTLSDPRFDYSELISTSKTKTFDEIFTCPSYWDGVYVDGVYSYDVENWAYLNGNIGLEDSATVTVNCEIGYDYETAYGLGNNATCFIPTLSNWGWTNLISDPYSGQWELWAGAAQCDTGKGTLVGYVDVSYSGGSLSVNFVVNEPYVLDETHVYAGSDEFPVNKKGDYIVAPGQYRIDRRLSGDIYVIAHAVVGIPQ